MPSLILLSAGACHCIQHAACQVKSSFKEAERGACVLRDPCQLLTSAAFEGVGICVWCRSSCSGAVWAVRADGAAYMARWAMRPLSRAGIRESNANTHAGLLMNVLMSYHMDQAHSWCKSVSLLWSPWYNSVVSHGMLDYINAVRHSNCPNTRAGQNNSKEACSTLEFADLLKLLCFYFGKFLRPLLAELP